MDNLRLKKILTENSLLVQDEIFSRSSKNIDIYPRFMLLNRIQEAMEVAYFVG